MGDDGEGTQLLQSILDLLLARGYFRARISALSAFDKLTGGLAWCITFSKVDVDFDIFYDDDATLYYKIKVGEAIEEALQRMGCPHPLQAHQIQGLDYKAVLPVVQWLVKRVLATLEEFGDQARRYAHLRYEKNYKLPNESSIQDARLDKIEAILEASVQEPVRKLLDSAKDDSLVASAEHPVVPSDTRDPDKAIQHESSFTDGSSAAVAPPQSTITEVMEDSPPGPDVGDNHNAVHTQQVQNLEKHIGAQNAQIARLQTEVDAATQSIEELEQTVTQQVILQCLRKVLMIRSGPSTSERQEERSAIAQAAIDDLQIAAKVAGAEPVVQKLMDLLEKSKNLEKQEADFRAECRRKRAEMQAHIKQRKDPAAAAAEDDEHSTEVNNAYNVDLQKWSTLRSELSKRNRAVALLQRRLDDMPSQTELMQYERRFVELYLHIQRKLRETRKYYATYNALAEAQEINAKELSLLNSIHSQWDLTKCNPQKCKPWITARPEEREKLLPFEAAMMTPGGRSKFVESMEGIAKGVQQKLHQIERRFEAEQSTYNALNEKHAAAVTAQREYYAFIKKFQEECARSEKLQSRLEQSKQTGNETVAKGLDKEQDTNTGGPL